MTYRTAPQDMTYRIAPLLSVTSDDLRTWDACYSDDEITRYFAGAESLTPRQIAEQDIKATDKVWVLVRCLRTADCVVFARRCVDSAAAADRYAADGDARYAAYAAAAARYAADGDARYAAYTAAAAAAAAAVADRYAADGDALYAADAAGARVQQIAWLLELLDA